MQSELVVRPGAGMTVELDESGVCVVALSEEGGMPPEPVTATLEALLERSSRLVVQLASWASVDWTALATLVAGPLAARRARLVLVAEDGGEADRALEASGLGDRVARYTTREEAIRSFWEVSDYD